MRMLTALIFIDDFLFDSTAVTPRIDLDIGPTYVKENTNVTLPKCHVTGSPTPEVEWKKVGGSLFPQAVVEDGKLKLLDVTKQDEGEYECTAKTPSDLTSPRQSLK